MKVRRRSPRNAWAPADVVARLAVAGPRAAAERRRTPSLVRRLPLGGQPVDEKGAAR
ncbi:MAG TPA: hypothetical protein VFV76_10710 [Actinomycetes bacterium]|nr:hypothetical protein [Actinomycetes bacterium]